MRLVLDLTPLCVPRTGIGNYLLGVTRALTRTEHEVVAVALAEREGLRRVEEALAGADVELRVIERPLANIWRRGWSALRRPPLERVVGRFDGLLVSDWWHPPQSGGVRATTIYDLGPLLHPEWTTRRIAAAHRLSYRHARAACDVVFAISDYTADDVVRLLDIERGRVVVAHPGVDERFRPAGERLELGGPYVLAVATLEPRKNLAAALAAHERLGGGALLAVAGAAGWGPQPELDRRGVVRLGYVDDADLPALYRGASALVFPSRFEGFGMPIVEAMACGTPVVASAHPSLDEACGDAALRADPERPAQLASALARALADPEELRVRGLEHARRFSWRRTADVVAEALEAARGRLAPKD